VPVSTAGRGQFRQLASHVKQQLQAAADTTQTRAE